MAKRLIPFSWTPASWGLKGKSRLIAEAEYNFEGEDLERALVKIDYTDPDSSEYKIEMLKLDRKFEKISKEDYDYAYSDLKFHDSHERTLAKLELDKKYGKITPQKYEKAVFSLRDEPWVGIVGSEFDKKNGPNGLSIEMDWNEAFIQLLVSNGYNGTNDEQIVEQWFEDVATEQFVREMQAEADGSIYDPNDPNQQQ